ncbi:G-protein coupled receptor 157 isoform X6 [Nycticebus coucang]|uniref:G-protein coupled receptor 157 isoform X6 n=1 Tax=Nycticebus coucang TaxID=9470 RepID=UPI00234C3ECD|nr:G-protein coupled receptor 157 isoform X6 [Nycticebus coucang]
MPSPPPPTVLVPSERAVVLLSCALSALGSGLLVATHALWPDLRSRARRLLLFLSLADLLSAASYFYGVLQDFAGPSWDCVLQGALSTFANTSSFFWTVAIALYLYLSIVRAARGPRTDRLLWVFHVVSIGTSKRTCCFPATEVSESDGDTVLHAPVHPHRGNEGHEGTIGQDAIFDFFFFWPGMGLNPPPPAYGTGALLLEPQAPPQDAFFEKVLCQGLPSPRELSFSLLFPPHPCPLPAAFGGTFSEHGASPSLILVSEACGTSIPPSESNFIQRPYP